MSNKVTASEELRNIFDVLNEEVPNEASDLVSTENDAHVIWNEAKIAVLRILDRRLGKVHLEKIELQKETTLNYNLVIKVQSCEYNQDFSFAKEYRSFLEIHREASFSGWIYSHHTSINNFIDSRYEITLAHCE